MKNRILKITSLISLGIALVGCSSVYDTVTHSEHQVVETGYSALHGAEWAYKSSDGNLTELSEKCNTGIFEDPCRRSGDGSIEFQWHQYKGNVSHGKLTVDGIVYKLDCASGNALGGKYACGDVG